MGEEVDEIIREGQSSTSKAEVKAEAESSTNAALEKAISNMDPNLLNALRTPKERAFVLKVESFLIENLANEMIERIKIANPMNPYQRMLVHRLADAFGLERIVDMKQSLASGEENKGKA